MESTTALNSKVAALEDEMRIVKGEVKQVLTEIRSAILAQDSPFIEGGGPPRSSRPIQIVPAVAEEPARVEIVVPQPEAPAAPQVTHAEPQHAQSQLQPEVHQAPHPAPSAPPVAQHPRPAPRWSLLTVASLAAWAEEAFQRIGAQRLAILLDLCEVSGYLPPEARQALARVGELDLPAPAELASPMEVTVLLRQLDALLQGEPQDVGPRLLY